MKKLFLSLLVLPIALAAYAQKPQAGESGFSIGLQGLQKIGVTSNYGDMGTLLYRYYLRNDLALRGRVDLTISNVKTQTADTLTGNLTEIDKTNFFSFEGGLQKNFGQNLKRIEPYITGEAMIGFGRAGTTDRTLTQANNVSHIITKPGTQFQLGLLSHVGFQYYFTDHLALGAEFGYGIQYSHTGEGKVESTVTANGQTTTQNTSDNTSSHSFNISGTGGDGTIMLSIFFDGIHSKNASATAPNP